MQTYHSVLYSDVTGARCDGYASSVTRTGAADAANVRPNPIRNLRVAPSAAVGTCSARKNAPGTDEHADGLRCGLDDGGGTHECRSQCYR